RSSGGGRARARLGCARGLLVSEYDPILPDRRSTRDRDQVEALFRAASGPYLRSPWGWFAWSLVLPAAALATRVVARRGGPASVLMLWSVAILFAGLIEAVPHFRARGATGSSLAASAMRRQGNLSLGAVAF